MTKRSINEQREATRDSLARWIVGLAVFLAVAVVAVLSAEHFLVLSAETIKVIERVFTASLALAGVVVAFYFLRRP